jgi:hypothetical protein
MKFLVEGIRCGNCERDITDALLHIDIGARGFRVDSIVDQTLEDAVWSGARPAAQYI